MKTFAGKWLLIPALLLVGGVACSSSPGASPTTYKSSTTAGGTVGIALRQWAVTPTAATISAGSVTFNVTNNGNIPHEFVVLRTDTPASAIKVGSFENESDRIDEDHAGTNVGETGDLEAGASKALTISLTPGHYVFVCNLPSHYRLGMHFGFIVS
jgi:uncharacterized cupredoxin-like copper-binding protein